MKRSSWKIAVACCIALPFSSADVFARLRRRRGHLSRPRQSSGWRWCSSPCRSAARAARSGRWRRGAHPGGGGGGPRLGVAAGGGGRPAGGGAAPHAAAPLERRAPAGGGRQFSGGGGGPHPGGAIGGGGRPAGGGGGVPHAAAPAPVVRAPAGGGAGRQFSGGIGAPRPGERPDTLRRSVAPRPSVIRIFPRELRVALRTPADVLPRASVRRRVSTRARRAVRGRRQARGLQPSAQWRDSTR